MESKNALAARGNFSLTTLNQDAMQAMAEELDGLGTVPFDQVKVPSGGSLAFEVPGEDPDRPETAAELAGIIIVHHPVNAYWKDAFNGGNEQPDCSSLDGKRGLVAETGELRACEGCPYNAFGSASDGSNGKACKNGHRIYLLRSGEALPILLTLPPTSLKAFRDYLAKRVVLRGKRCYNVITKITLSKAKNSGGIVYSTCNFVKTGDLSGEEIEAIRPTVEWVQETARKVPASVQDAQTYPASDKYIDIANDDGDLPFPSDEDAPSPSK
jgi:hypothetical protein